MSIGDWFEYNDKVYEIEGATPTDWICREVLINSADPKLKYGEAVAIGKGVVNDIYEQHV